MPKLPSIKIKELIKILESIGFARWRQKGSHLSLYREGDNRILTLPVHFGKDVPTGTLRVIISQSGLTVEEFLKLR